MTQARPYATPRSDDEALEELRRCAGAQFDPAVVAALEAVLAAAASARPAARRLTHPVAVAPRMPA